jgi:hypothetical protein
MISLRPPGEGGKTDRSGKHVPFGLRPMAAIARQLRDSAGCVCLCSVLSICRRIERDPGLPADAVRKAVAVDVELTETRIALVHGDNYSAASYFTTFHDAKYVGSSSAAHRNIRTGQSLLPFFSLFTQFRNCQIHATCQTATASLLAAREVTGIGVGYQPAGLLPHSSLQHHS